MEILYNKMETDLFPKLEKKGVKTIAIKLQTSYKILIEQKCVDGDYSCFSEFIRIAMSDYISTLLVIISQGGKMVSKTIFSQDTKEKKIPISIKIPIGFLTITDFIIKTFHFRDRSKFIRQAIFHLLEEETQ